MGSRCELAGIHSGQRPKEEWKGGRLPLWNPVPRQSGRSTVAFGVGVAYNVRVCVCSSFSFPSRLSVPHAQAHPRSSCYRCCRHVRDICYQLVSRGSSLWWGGACKVSQQRA
uniref:Uncharacterized protein n=1 Tax=Trypanosoma congolense (strain IL3000) TaxID=1068625 RepID=G0ULE0_TRYCI|nr:hypothetical protein, unlikely [Trypanosoma congolense IL3000]